MNNNNTRTKNKRTSVLNKLRSMTIKNFKRNENHNKNEEEKKDRRKKNIEDYEEKKKKNNEERKKKQREEKIINIGYFRLAEMSYYDMSKKEQERIHDLMTKEAHKKIREGIREGIRDNRNSHIFNHFLNISPWLSSYIMPKSIRITREKSLKVKNSKEKNYKEIYENLYNDYTNILYLYDELKTKGELNEEAIELGTESFDTFDDDILIRKKYEKEIKEKNEKKKKEEEDKKKEEEDDKKRKDEARLNDETETKAEIHVKSAIDYLVKHLHTHVKNKRDMHAWSATAYNPRTWITGPYEGTYAVRQGLKKYKEEWEKYYNTLD
jgi:hypothetical protein